MTRSRVIVAVLGVIVLLALISAVGQTGTIEDFRYEISALGDQPWGLATIVNLYAGFALLAVIMVLVERSLIKGLIWAAPLLLLGNIWAAIWLLLRLPRIADLVKPRD